MLNRVTVFLLSLILIVTCSLDAHSVLYTDKEVESDADIYHVAVKYYDPYAGRFISRDPSEYGVNWYAYANNNPMKYTDPDGLEPVQKAAAGVDEFVEYLSNNKPTELSEYKSSLGREGLKPKQNYIRFRNDKPRYIATQKYGWVDMQHFMAAAAETVYLMRTDVPGIAHDKAIVRGEAAEEYQALIRSNSAWSYEDLPSNKAGADFGAYHYDPDGAPLAEQVGAFLNTHARPEGVRQQNSITGKWDWAEPPESFHALPETPTGKKPIAINKGYTPIDPSKL